MPTRATLPLLALLLIALPSAHLRAQTANASSIPATARIYVPITAALVNSGLSFGDIFSNVPGGNVVLDPATNLRTTTGGLVLGTAGAVNAAVIKVGGVRGNAIAISLPLDAAVTLVGPGTTMALVGFTCAVGTAELAAPFLTQLPLVAGATVTFQVGATLVVPANQLDGNYVGAFAVTVAYN
jgi:hypothetical protein